MSKKNKTAAAQTTLNADVTETAPETTTAPEALVGGEPVTKAVTVIKNGKPRRTHKAADLAPKAEAAPVPETTVELDATEPDALEEAGSYTAHTDPAMQAEAQAAEDAVEATAPESHKQEGEKFGWLKRVNAQRAIDHAIASLSKHDFSQWPEVGVNGVSGAIAILKNASGKMATLNKKAKPGKPTLAGIEVGGFVKLTAKVAKAGKYEGIIQAEVAHEVLWCDKRYVRILAAGDKATLPIVDVERAAS